MPRTRLAFSAVCAILYLMEATTREQIKGFDLTEIINGEEIMGAGPFGRHQAIIGKLHVCIYNHIESNHIGNVLLSPLDVIFEEGTNRLQPDLLFIKKENMHIFQDWIRGVPDMVCEVVSTGSVALDTATKRDIYEQYKVPEYWIVMPEFKAIEILALEGDRYKLFSSAEGEGTVRSRIIEGLNIDIKNIFES